ncbi:phospholipid carrier-dependent glycosyltransferase [Shimia marina]|uniref:phospholipid carrier-dependent glycosyltransferase n=1 Tax=Shimia marina TaxID=321267 RepID=UPI00130E598A|nr:phospholipid carrier-dependent glycosyltransferase [Shimia marina]
MGYFFGDERINDAAKVLTGQLVPGQHFYPPLLNYLNAIAFVAMYVIGLPLGWWEGLSDFRAQYFSDPTVFYVTARLVVAALGATLAPIAYLLARHFGLSTLHSVSVGAIAALFPLAVHLSHFAKGDIPLGAATALCFLAVAYRVTQGNGQKEWQQDAAVGLSFALAMSFKQSAIFGLLPLSIGMFVLLAQRQSSKTALRSYGRAVLIFVPAWSILNIGILLDFQRFLEFQGIQSAMSVSQKGGTWAGISQMLGTLLAPQYGIGWILGIAAILGGILVRLETCQIKDKPLWRILWISSAIGAVTIAALTGTRQPTQLFIAPFGELLILGAILLAGFAQSAKRQAALLGKVSLATTLLGFAIYMVHPIAQAMRTPLADTIDVYLAQTHADDRVVTMMRTKAKQSPAARDWEDARLQRLAAKYNVALPEVAPESRAAGTSEQAIFWVPLPQAMYGLEDVTEGEETYTVQAHTWPLQPEEWQLQYWTQQGFTVFVLSDVAYHLEQRPSEVVSQFFEEIVTSCQIERSFPPAKPMYLEYLTEIYVCT